MTVPRYLIRVPVERAHGEQGWEIEAASPEEALALYLAGDGKAECVYEDLEVEKAGEPTVEEAP
jgi:hypothetical protein